MPGIPRKGDVMEPHRFLCRKEASAYLQKTYGLRRAPSTLAKLAVIGGGPVFRRINRVPLYSIDDLDEWVASKLSGPMRSTSDRTASATEAAGSRQQIGLNGGNASTADRKSDFRTRGEGFRNAQS
jgi:hypothetical protein